MDIDFTYKLLYRYNSLSSHSVCFIKGFEARGTTLAQRLIAWQNLMEASKPRGQLIDNPLEYYYYKRQLHQQVTVSGAMYLILF